MRFDSLAFGLFFLLTFLSYWMLQPWGHRAQNVLLLLAGCVFYGWLDYRFLALLLCGTSCDYLVGMRLMTAVRPGCRRFLLGLSIAAGIGTLAAFKYTNFFLESVAALLKTAGVNTQIGTLNILLPLGISFFTLQRLTYVFDIYRRRLAATRDFLSFAVFSTFFPLLLSGPIERAARLLPQFEQDRVFDLEKSKDALRQILWGLFKKIVIADNLSGRVAFVFANFDRLPGIDLAAGAFLFAVQLYADFSGYSDIAIGVSRLLGIRVMRNFAYPYFSRDMAEFWRRWHISLSTWFRDYVYSPLSMNLSLRARARRMGCVLLGTVPPGPSWSGASSMAWGLPHLCFGIRRRTKPNKLRRDADFPHGARDWGLERLLPMLCWHGYSSAPNRCHKPWGSSPICLRIPG